MRNSNKFNYIFQMPSAKLYEHQINIFSIICARVFVCTFNILQCSLDYTCYFLSLTLLFVQSIKNIFKEFFDNKKIYKNCDSIENCGRSVRGKVGYKNFICILLNSNWAYCVICKFITTQMVRSHSPLHISLARFSSNSIQMKWKKKNMRETIVGENDFGIDRKIAQIALWMASYTRIQSISILMESRAILRSMFGA